MLYFQFGDYNLLELKYKHTPIVLLPDNSF